MPTAREMKTKLWNSLRSDQTVMVGLEGAKDPILRPMTAQFKGRNGTIWFFTSRKSLLAKNAKFTGKGIATFTTKNHDMFATIRGKLVVDRNRATLNALWNSFVAAWFEKGKDDPDLVLLRFDCKSAEVWLNASSLVAGIKLLLGVDPKSDYKGKVAKLDL